MLNSNSGFKKLTNLFKGEKSTKEDFNGTDKPTFEEVVVDQEKQSSQLMEERSSQKREEDAEDAKSAGSEKNEGSSFQLFQDTDSLKRDKDSLDLIVAVEQMVRSKKNIEFNLKELQDRLQHSQYEKEVLEKENRKTNENIEENRKQINMLEQKIADKNAVIDQMMEDYKDLQSSMSHEVDELKNQLALLQEKYQKAQEKYNNDSMEAMNSIKQRDERILDLETENENLKDLYNNIRDENSRLLGIVNEFSNQMSSSFKNYADKGSKNE